EAFGEKRRPGRTPCTINPCSRNRAELHSPLHRNCWYPGRNPHGIGNEPTIGGKTKKSPAHFDLVRPRSTLPLKEPARLASGRHGELALATVRPARLDLFVCTSGRQNASYSGAPPTWKPENISCRSELC